MEGKGAQADKKQLFKDKEQQDVRSSRGTLILTQTQAPFVIRSFFDSTFLACRQQAPSSLALCKHPFCHSETLPLKWAYPLSRVVLALLLLLCQRISGILSITRLSSLSCLCCAAAHRCCLFAFSGFSMALLSHTSQSQFTLMRLAEPV
jgi:hypothetical protein